MEKLVGIVAPARMREEDDPKKDEYYFSDFYGKRIQESGGAPLGILPVDGWVSEKILDRFDSFLICGGRAFWPYHLQVVHHAVTTGKPLLGVCLGMQSIYCYFRTVAIMEDTGRQGNLWESFRETQRLPEGSLQQITGHRAEHIRGRDEETKHEVKLLPGSRIHRLMGTDTIRAASFHSYRIPKAVGGLTVSGTAEDGTIEVIEYGEKILGVQFHPEIDRELMPIFDILVK